jgi:hypothetical protein
MQALANDGVDKHSSDDRLCQKNKPPPLRVSAKQAIKKQIQRYFAESSGKRWGLG